MTRTSGQPRTAGGGASGVRVAMRGTRLTRVIGALCLCLAWTVPALAAESDAGQAIPSPPDAAEALAAYDRFRAAPAQGLADAATFLRYMQGGAVHTVLDDRLMFFMYRDLPADVRAVLYAAYMGGNLDSQLRTRKAGDDPVAGMQGVLAAYASLRAARPTLAIAELDTLAAAAAAARLPAAIEALRNGTP